MFHPFPVHSSARLCAISIGRKPVTLRRSGPEKTATVRWEGPFSMHEKTTQKWIFKGSERFDLTCRKFDEENMRLSHRLSISPLCEDNKRLDVPRTKNEKILWDVIGEFKMLQRPMIVDGRHCPNTRQVPLVEPLTTEYSAQTLWLIRVVVQLAGNEGRASANLEPAKFSPNADRAMNTLHVLQSSLRTPESDLVCFRPPPTLMNSLQCSLSARLLRRCI